MAIKVGFLGPEGTFSGEALALFYKSHQVIPIPYGSLVDIFADLAQGELDEGIVPLENSYEGPVNLTMDLLAGDYPVKITGEFVLTVSHNLMAREGVAPGQLTAILSHPQALAQCRSYIRRNFPGIPLVETSSTAEAAKIVAETDKFWAAIANIKAAEAFNLALLDKDISDLACNMTRFVILGREGCLPTVPAKTSILVSVTDRPGALYHILKEFALRNINLTRIESRPAKKRLGDYLFFIDFEGHAGEQGVAEALEAVARQAADYRNLGSYSADSGFTSQGRPAVNIPMTLEEVRSGIDIIDFQIVELLGKRAGLVNLLTGLKKGSPVRDPDRERRVLARVKETAKQKGFSPEVIEEIYGILFRHFVRLQDEKTKP